MCKCGNLHYLSCTVQILTLKSGKNAFLTVEWPLVRQPDNFISMQMASIFTDLQALNYRNCSQMVNWSWKMTFFWFLVLFIGFFKKNVPN